MELPLKLLSGVAFGWPWSGLQQLSFCVVKFTRADGDGRFPVWIDVPKATVPPNSNGPSSCACLQVLPCVSVFFLHSLHCSSVLLMYNAWRLSENSRLVACQLSYASALTLIFLIKFSITYKIKSKKGSDTRQVGTDTDKKVTM
jgi:hypothetical protein